MRRKRGSGKPKAKGTCYMCGKVAPRSTMDKDHIPARNIFGEEPPPNLITLDACPDCHNDQLSKAEEYFRNVVVSLSHDRPSTNTQWEKVQRSIHRPEGKRLAAKMRDDLVREIDMFSRGGIFLGTTPGMKLDQDLVGLVFNKLVRGLFYFHYKPRLIPPEAKIIISRVLYGLQDIDIHTELELLLGAPLHEIGKGTFSYRIVTTPDHDYSSIWGLRFYDIVLFTAICIPPEMLVREDQARPLIQHRPMIVR